MKEKKRVKIYYYLINRKFLFKTTLHELYLDGYFLENYGVLIHELVVMHKDMFLKLVDFNKNNDQVIILEDLK